jgi:hypothetical protein
MTLPLTKKQWEASVAEMWSASVKATCQDLIDEAVKAEREACAKIADEWAVGWPHPSEVIAERIRARGQA